MSDLRELAKVFGDGPASPPKRFCLSFVGDQQCLADATHVCGTADGLEWYACPEHAVLGVDHCGDAVAAVTPLAEWWLRMFVREAPP